MPSMPPVNVPVVGCRQCRVVDYFSGSILIDEKWADSLSPPRGSLTRITHSDKTGLSVGLLRRLNLIHPYLEAVASLPRLPPPEPPSMFVEIHEIRPEVDQDVGYMRPSFHRHDGVPGDVRSPPPTGRPVFDFPTTPDTTR